MGQTFQIKLQGEADIKAFIETVKSLEATEAAAKKTQAKIDETAATVVTAAEKWTAPLKTVASLTEAQAKLSGQLADAEAKAASERAAAAQKAAAAIVAAEKAVADARWAAHKANAPDHQVIVRPVVVDTKPLEEVEGKMQNVRQSLLEGNSAAHEFLQTLKMGAAISFGGNIVEKLAEIPGAFREAIYEGVKFNQFTETSTLGIAASIQSSDPGRFLNFGMAKEEAKKNLEEIRQEASRLGLDFHSLAESISISIPVLQEAGITTMDKQINTMTLLNQTAAAKGIDGFRAQRDIIDLMMGIGERTVFGKELASQGVDNKAIEEAKAMGTLYDLLQTKLKAYGDAGSEVATTLSGRWATLSNELDKSLGAFVKPVFDVLKDSLGGFAQMLADPAMREDLNKLGDSLGRFSRYGADMVKWMGEVAAGKNGMLEALTAADDARKDIVQRTVNSYGETELDAPKSQAAALNLKIRLAKTPEEKEKLRAELIEFIQAQKEEAAALVAAGGPALQIQTHLGEIRLASHTRDTFDKIAGKQGEMDAAIAPGRAAAAKATAEKAAADATQHLVDEREHMTDVLQRAGVADTEATKHVAALTKTYEKQVEVLEKLTGLTLKGKSPSELNKYLLEEAPKGLDGPGKEKLEKLLHDNEKKGPVKVLEDTVKIGAKLEAEKAALERSRELEDTRAARDEERAQKESDRVAKSKELLKLEEAFSRAKITGDEQAIKAADERLKTYQLMQRIIGEQGISAPEALRAATEKVSLDREAKNAEDERKAEAKTQKRSNRNTDLDALFDNLGSRNGSTGISSGLKGFDELQSRTTRSTFQFPGLDAFEAMQTDRARNRPVSSVQVPFPSSASGGFGAGGAAGAMSGGVAGGIAQMAGLLEMTKAVADGQAATREIDSCRQRIEELNRSLVGRDAAQAASALALKTQLEATIRSVEQLRTQIANNRS